MIRQATAADAAGILSIYEPFIRDTSLTFETEVPSLADFENRIASYTTQFPWLVAIEQQDILGYAYASRYRERAGYQWSVECSIYVREEQWGSGLAGKLYDALFLLLRAQGFTTVYAVINLPNDRSVRFHEKMGFRYLVTYEKVGFKLGRWKDVGWWQLRLNNFSENPMPPIPITELGVEWWKKITVSMC